MYILQNREGEWVAAYYGMDGIYNEEKTYYAGTGKAAREDALGVISTSNRKEGFVHDEERLLAMIWRNMQAGLLKKSEALKQMTDLVNQYGAGALPEDYVERSSKQLPDPERHS